LLRWKFRLMHVSVGLLLVSLSAAHAKLATARMPEFYANSSVYCAVHFSTKAQKSPASRGQLLRTISRLYQISNKWTSFAVINVDYLDFRQFDLIAFASCTDQSKISALVRKAETLGPYRDEVSTTAPGISTIKLLDQTPSAVKRFRLLNPQASLEDCIFGLKVRPAKNALVLSDAILSLWIKYRLPFADVNVANDTIYVMLARECANKFALYNELRALLVGAGLNVDEYAQFVAEPDLSNYLYVQPFPAH